MNLNWFDFKAFYTEINECDRPLSILRESFNNNAAFDSILATMTELEKNGFEKKFKTNFFSICDEVHNGMTVSTNISKNHLDYLQICRWILSDWFFWKYLGCLLTCKKFFWKIRILKWPSRRFFDRVSRTKFFFQIKNFHF